MCVWRACGRVKCPFSLRENMDLIFRVRVRLFCWTPEQYRRLQALGILASRFVHVLQVCSYDLSVHRWWYCKFSTVWLVGRPSGCLWPPASHCQEFIFDVHHTSFCCTCGCYNDDTPPLTTTTTTTHSWSLSLSTPFPSLFRRMPTPSPLHAVSSCINTCPSFVKS